MALLAYLIMVAALMTSAFVGYEWVATSSKPKVAVYSTMHTKTVRLVAKAKLASKARLAATSLPTTSDGDPGLANTATAKEASARHRRTAHIRQLRERIVAQRSIDGTAQMALGFAEESRIAPSASLER